MAFRILDPFGVFFDLQGRLADGGSLEFYQAGTETPADVYADKALTVNNGPTVAIGSDGRPTLDTWGDISYRVRAYDANGTLIADRDNIEVPGAAGATIPTLDPAKFLTNDGALLSWADILQVPDPTGQSNKYLSNDGALPLWQTLPSITQPNTTVNTDSLKLSDGTNAVLMQKGTDSAPASGTSTTTKLVTFPTAFSEIWFVCVSITDAGNSNVGFTASTAVVAQTISGFTFSANVSAHQGGSGSDANITSAVPFEWFAIGKVSA